jgi:hypothetical protein
MVLIPFKNSEIKRWADGLLAAENLFQLLKHTLHRRDRALKHL